MLLYVHGIVPTMELITDVVMSLCLRAWLRKINLEDLIVTTIR